MTSSSWLFFVAHECASVIRGFSIVKFNKTRFQRVKSEVFFSYYLNIVDELMTSKIFSCELTRSTFVLIWWNWFRQLTKSFVFRCDERQGKSENFPFTKKEKCVINSRHFKVDSSDQLKWNSRFHRMITTIAGSFTSVEMKLHQQHQREKFYVCYSLINFCLWTLATSRFISFASIEKISRICWR